MGIKVFTDKVMIYDNDQNKMVIKTKVSSAIVTNKGTVLFEEGPLFCENGQEIFEATLLLRRRLIQNLPGLQDYQINSHQIM